MVAFNFQAQFAPAVRSGEKRQTIRASLRCRQGDDLQLYTGQRTKKCEHLGDAVCSSVESVRLYQRKVEIGLGPASRAITSRAKLDAFAVDDGFNNYADMLAWFFFRPRNGIVGDCFAGWLIKWEPL